MRTFGMTVAILSVTFGLTATPAQAQPDLQFATALVCPFSLKDGTGLPLVSSNWLVALFHLSTNWNAMARVGFGTGFDIFRPSPRGLLGIGYRLHDKFRLGLSVSYAYIPHWEKTPSDGHLVGGAVAPVFPLPGGLALALPIGVSHNFTADASSGSVAIEFSVPLPLL